MIRPLPAAPAFEHAGHQLGNQQVGDANVVVERGLEGRHVLLDGECRGKACSVVDDDVDITRLQRKLLYGVEISEVGLYEADGSADLVDRLFAAFSVPARDDDRGTFLRPSAARRPDRYRLYRR